MSYLLGTSTTNRTIPNRDQKKAVTVGLGVIKRFSWDSTVAQHQADREELITDAICVM